MRKNRMLCFAFIIFASITLFLSVINIKQITKNYKNRPYNLSEFYIKFDIKDDINECKSLNEKIVNKDNIIVLALFDNALGVYDPSIFYEPYSLWQGSYFHSSFFESKERKELRYIGENPFNNISDLVIGYFDDYYILNSGNVDFIYNYNSDLKLADTYYIDFIDQNSKDEFISLIKRENIVNGEIEEDSYQFMDYISTIFTNKEALIFSLVALMTLLNMIILMRSVYIRERKKIILSDKIGINPLFYFKHMMIQQFLITVVAIGFAIVIISLILNYLNYDIMLSYSEIFLLYILFLVLFTLCSVLASVLVFLQKGDG